MFKLRQMILMLCLILSGALCYANGEIKLEKKGDGTPIEIIEKACHGGEEKGSFILPSVNYHVLTVVFSKNLGQVSVEVATSAGATVEYTSVLTPNGLQVYIPNEGNYIVTFTFSNGDEYYGEFTVMD